MKEKAVSCTLTRGTETLAKLFIPSSPTERALESMLMKVRHVLRPKDVKIRVSYIQVCHGDCRTLRPRRCFSGATREEAELELFDFACASTFGKGYVFTRKPGDSAGVGVAAKPTGRCSFECGPRVRITYEVWRGRE